MSLTLVGRACLHWRVVRAQSVNDKVRWTSDSSFVYFGGSRVRGV